MEKFIIKGVKQVANEGNERKAIVQFINARNKVVNTKRTIWNEDGKNIILFKGIKLEAKLNENKVATEVTVIEAYDKKIKNNKANAPTIEINLGNGIVTEIKKQITIPEVKKPIELPKAQTPAKPKVIKHMQFDLIKGCVEAEIPVYLYGPAGSGKNHVLQQIAEELNLEFFFTNSVQQEYKITGFIDAGGKYHETEFYKAFVNGGLFFLDEMDASIPEVLVLLNAALANGYFEFPNGKVNAHKDFRVVAAGNTVGTGADEQYSGRLQLDQATLDRFAFIEFDYDRNIELAIANNNEELVQFIRSLRKQAQEKGINATFSYRCISMVTKLEGKLELKEVLRIAVVKGLDKDTLNTFATSATNKYSKALWMLKQAV